MSTSAHAHGLVLSHHRSGEDVEPLLSRPLVWGFVASFALRTNLYVLSVVMTAYCMERYGCDIAVASLATGILTIGCLVARFIGGAITERIGLVPTTLIGYALTAVASLLYLAMGSVQAVILVRFLHGIFYGIASTTITSIASVSIPSSRHGEGMGYFMLSVTLASAAGPLLGISLLGSDLVVPLFVCASALGVVGFVATLCCGQLSEEEQEEGEALEKITALAPAAPEADFSCQGVRLIHTPASLDRFLELSVLPGGMLVFLSYLVYGAVSAYLDPFAEQAHLMGAATFFFVAYAAAMLVSRPFTSKILDRRGPTPLMVPGFVVLGVGIGLMGLARTDWMLLLAAALIGYALGSIQPTGLALATKYLSRSRYTVANATFYMMSDTAVGISPIIFGLVIPLLGYRGLFLALVALALAGLVAYEGLHHAQLI